MSCRTLLKIIAFVCGLYFFLEFLLPEKIGGDFDRDGVHSPVMVRTPDGPVILYVGQYAEKDSSLGRLVRAGAAGAGWRREPDDPVLQRTLFVPYEKGGMRQLDAVAGASGIDLFYLGLNRQQETTLCHASGDSSGRQWKRTGAVLFATNGVPRPTVGEPNGELPGRLVSFTAAHDAGRWVFLLAMKMGGGLEIWPAAGESLSAVRLGPSAILAAGQVPAGLTALDGQCTGGRWTIDLMAADGFVRFVQQPDNSFIREATGNRQGGGDLVTGLRTEKTGDASVISFRRSGTNDAGQKVSSTEILAGPRPEGPAAGGRWTEKVKSAGRAGQSTYLSQWAPAIANSVQIIGSFAIFIALINLTMFHGKRIARLQQGSVHSVIFFVFTIAMAIIAYIGQPGAAAQTGWGRSFRFVLEGVIMPMGTAVFSMITFFMISAAYRSFRVRSLEAALLMIAACVVMLGQMPIGQWMTGSLPEWMHFMKLPWLAEKLLWLANACAYRGVLIGIAVGGLAIGLRIWLGLDNTVYSGMEEKK